MGGMPPAIQNPVLGLLGLGLCSMTVQGSRFVLHVLTGVWCCTAHALARIHVQVANFHPLGMYRRSRLTRAPTYNCDEIVFAGK